MKRSRFSEEQIAYALRLAESGTPVVDVCRQIGVSEATYYTWKKKFGDLGVPQHRSTQARRRHLVLSGRVVHRVATPRPARRSAAGTFERPVECAHAQGGAPGHRAVHVQGARARRQRPENHPSDVAFCAEVRCRGMGTHRNP
ncbi:transposase [Variovorax ureilyticus]|uniref:Transposase n=1 Tax=Variovorax ureilyticus TaxID=1836198 RepID=A0ABU8VL15_9BURK